MDTTTTLDPAKCEAFGERMTELLNGGALALMISIGHRTGLFDALGELPPSTCDAIAERAALDERYVREWLGALVTGGVLEHDPALGHFWLPPEHAAFLTRAAAPSNLAATTQFIAVLGGVEDRIVECFARGGGVPYSAYPRFHEVMAEDSAQTVVAGLEGAILPLVPGLVQRLEAGIDVLDVGCGRGMALNHLARAFPASRFTGYDFSDEAVAGARRDARASGSDNARFEVRDAARLEDRGAFDLITAFDAIHDQADPAGALAGIARALRPGGVFLMQDIHGSSHVHGNLEHPVAPFLYTVSCMHCMTVSLASGGAGLGAMWGRETALAMLCDAGFASVRVERLPHDEINDYYVATR